MSEKGALDVFFFFQIKIVSVSFKISTRGLWCVKEEDLDLNLKKESLQFVLLNLVFQLMPLFQIARQIKF